MHLFRLLCVGLCLALGSFQAIGACSISYNLSWNVHNTSASQITLSATPTGSATVTGLPYGSTVAAGQTIAITVAGQYCTTSDGVTLTCSGGAIDSKTFAEANYTGNCGGPCDAYLVPGTLNTSCAGGGSTIQEAVACIGWTNTGPTWAEFQIYVQDNTGTVTAPSWFSAAAVAPGKSFQRCFTNYGSQWCGAGAGWVAGDSSARATVPDTSGTFTCTSVATPTSTNSVAGPTSTNIANVFDPLATNSVVSATNTAATSSDINKLGNALIQAVAAVERAISAAQTTNGDSFKFSVSFPTNYPDAVQELLSSQILTNATNQTAKLQELLSNGIPGITNLLGSINSNDTRLLQDTTNLLTAVTNLLAYINTNTAGLGSNLTAGLSTNLGTNLSGLGTNLEALTTNFAHWKSNEYAGRRESYGLSSNLNSLFNSFTNTEGWANTNSGNRSNLAAQMGEMFGTNVEGFFGIKDKLAQQAQQDAISGYGTQPGSTWGMIALGSGDFLDIKAALSLAVFEDYSAGFRHTGTTYNYASTAGGIRSVLRIFIAWFLLVQALLYVADQLNQIILQYAMIPQVPQFEDWQIFGTDIPGAAFFEHAIRVTMIIAFGLLIPSVAVVTFSTAYSMFGDAGSISGAVTAITSGGFSSLTSVIPELNEVCWLVNQWFPVPEFFVICLNVVVVKVTLLFTAVKSAIFAKCL